MKISLIGVSHHTAPIEVRERLHFPEKDLPAALHALAECDGVEEGLIVSTCNRVEILTRLTDNREGLNLLAGFLAQHRRMAREVLDRHLYHHAGREAIRHIFRVASSLDSMVVGEPQVLGQVKAAYATARAVGTVGGILDEVVSHAFAAAKKVRSETGIASSAVSISYAAVELAKKIFGSLEGKNVFLIGAGEMSELAARHLLENGAQAIFVANRTFARAEELAKEWAGQAIRFDKLLDFVSRADIIISSTGSPVYIIKKEHGARFLAERKNRPMFFIDIAVPRDIDPEMNHLSNIFLYDIDDLQQVVQANLRQRQREAKRAEEIVNREVEHLLARLKRLEVTPTIVALQAQLNEIREQELARLRAHEMPPEQRAAVEEMARRMVNKILHGPLTTLKRLPQETDGLRMIEMARRMFRLKD